MVKKKRYCTKKHLFDQIKFKVLPIVKASYLRYRLLFIYDNTISLVIYTKNASKVAQINIKPRKQKPFLRLGWYKTANRKIIIQDIFSLSENLITD